MKDLKHKALRGFFWSVVEQWTYHGLNGLAFIVFARVLSPTDFGTWGIAVIYMGFASLPINFGLRDAVIQKKEISGSELTSIFFFQCLACLAVVCLTLLAAPLLAEALGIPALRTVLKICCLIIAGDGLCTLQEALFQKQLNFSIGALRRLAGMLVGSSVGITAALMGAGLWSLVLFHVCASITRLLVLWSASSWRPRGRPSWNAAKSFYRFGKQTLFTSFLTKIKDQADSMLVGALLGHVALGYYTFALRICAILHELVSATLSQIVMPVFALLQDDLPRARRAYLKLVHASALIGLPAFLGALATAPLFIPLFFGKAWIPVIPIFQLIALGGAAQTLRYKSFSILNALGHPSIQFRLTALNCLLAIPLLWLAAAFYSLPGVAAVFGLINWLYWFRAESEVQKKLSYAWKDFFDRSTGPCMGALGMSGILWLCHHHFRPTPAWITLALYVLLGVTFYLLVVLARDRLIILEELKGLRKQWAAKGVAP